MRNLFETGKITEVIFYSENGKGAVRITMTETKCFDIRQFDNKINYWVKCFETSSKCDWSEAKRYANSLLNRSN